MLATLQERPGRVKALAPSSAPSTKHIAFGKSQPLQSPRPRGRFGHQTSAKHSLNVLPFSLVRLNMSASKIKNIPSLANP